MTFNLSIFFSGLSLFAIDDTNPAGARLEVLLMKCPSAPHVPVLLYDTSFVHNVDTNEAKDFLCTRLDNAWLDFPANGLSAPQFNSIPSTIADLDDLAGVGKMSRDYVGGKSTQVAGARFTLPTGKPGSSGLGSTFTVATPSGTKTRKLAHFSEWIIEGLNSTVNGREGLQLAFGKFDPNSSVVPPTLPLYAQNKMVRVVVLNAEPKDIPPNQPAMPNIGDCASHFEAYYQVFPKATQQQQQVIPKLSAIADDPSPFRGYRDGCLWAGKNAAQLQTISVPICIHAKVHVQPPSAR